MEKTLKALRKEYFDGEITFEQFKQKLLTLIDERSDNQEILCYHLAVASEIITTERGA